jgi:hypothetical protein
LSVAAFRIAASAVGHRDGSGEEVLHHADSSGL